ncbi:serine hydrolase domain-containing protein [Streptomyces sp. P1-3]|uniref:serine hydrolase domain-containing protein n=1 Tax=Streptomyces sp. P1-3 TaxID=3421658 RepID=UPI003D36CB76
MAALDPSRASDPAGGGAAGPVGAGGAGGRLLAVLAAAAPGASTVVVVARQGGRRVVAVTGTTAHDGAARAADPHTRFELGSVTKTYTALLLADMVARGEVRYTDPIARFLPRGAVPPGPGSRITLLHLATHTSGLPRLPRGFLRRAVPLWCANPYAGFGTGDLLAALARTRPDPAPGTRVRYSNFGVGLLGLLLARAAGAGFPELLTDRVLAPLALSRTGCADDESQATGYWHGRPRPSWRIPGLAAAGAVRSTGHDLLRYLEALLAPDTAAGGAPGSLRAALADVARPRLAVRAGGDRISLLWNVRRRPGHDVYFHSGGTRGFVSLVGFSPQRDVALAAVANTSPTLDGRFIQRAYLALRDLAADPAPDGSALGLDDGVLGLGGGALAPA